MLKKSLSALLCLCMVFALAACGGTAGSTPASTGGTSTASTGSQGSTPAPSGDFETIRLSFGSVGTRATSLPTTHIEDFITSEVNKRLAESTNYQIDWNMMYGGTAAKAGEEVDALQSGIVDIHTIIYPYEVSRMPLHQMFYWFPFASPSVEVAMETARRINEEFPIMNESMLETYNIKMLNSAVMQMDFGLLTSFEVNTVEDMKGHKVAAGGNNLTLVSAAGGTPVQSAIAESYTSISTGVYEGWINDIVTGDMWNLYEVAPYYTKTNFGANCIISFGMNADKAASLPPEVMSVIEDVFYEYSDYLVGVYAQAQEDCEGRWTEGGGQINQMSDAEIEKWAALVSDTAKTKATEADALGLPGTELAKRFYEIQAELGHEWPYELDF